ncbi:MAG: CHAT domain-containing protein [Leptolyngbyaceae cyanobacterium SL_5_9]|nr:CHAT domain-containing protein [Leptolyngbyaceae cyanobacterium SL_5_9]
MSDKAALKSILLLAANPKGTQSLRLQEEEREIRERLRLAGYGKVPINSTGAARPRDIQQAMLDFKPQIVHFSGHGVGQEGLAFEDVTGREKLVSSEALANLFKLFSEFVKCVVLNACYSKFQAEAIAQHIDYVIGMSQSIGDRAAIEFTVGFYTALGAGESIEFAYNLGCNAIQLDGVPEHLTPVLFKRNRKELKSVVSYQDLTNLESSYQSFYIERPFIESACYKIIMLPGALIRIKAPWQMGKTSLMLKILNYAAQQGHNVVRLSFQEADSEIFNSLDLFLQWLCTNATYALNLEDKIEDFWNKGKMLGSKFKATNYFQNHLLSSFDTPLVLGLDEADLVLCNSAVGDNFFGLLRAWHERGKNDVVWSRLRIIITHSFEALIPSNSNQSPFNVGWEHPTFAKILEVRQDRGVKLGTLSHDT